MTRLAILAYDVLTPVMLPIFLCNMSSSFHMVMRDGTGIYGCNPELSIFNRNLTITSNLELLIFNRNLRITLTS
jgi:hypothetical protein